MTPFIYLDLSFPIQKWDHVTHWAPFLGLFSRTEEKMNGKPFLSLTAKKQEITKWHRCPLHTMPLQGGGTPPLFQVAGRHCSGVLASMWGQQEPMPGGEAG